MRRITLKLVEWKCTVSQGMGGKKISATGSLFVSIYIDDLDTHR